VLEECAGFLLAFSLLDPQMAKDFTFKAITARHGEVEIGKKRMVGFQIAVPAIPNLD
jgi:hypothetical protein